jgi:hypothetical protein
LFIGLLFSQNGRTICEHRRQPLIYGHIKESTASAKNNCVVSCFALTAKSQGTKHSGFIPFISRQACRSHKPTDKSRVLFGSVAFLVWSTKGRAMSDNAPESTPAPEPTPEPAASTESAAASDDRVIALELKLAEVEASMAFAGRMRQMLLLGVVALVAVIGVLFGQLVTRVQSDDYLKEIQDHAEAHLKKNEKIYLDEMQRLVSAVQPKLTEAFMAQAKKDTPEYTKAIDRQRQLLATNLEIKFTDLLNQHYENSLAKSEEILVREFPKAQDDDVRRKLMANMNLATQKVAKEFQVDYFKEELNKLYEVWETFPSADAPDEGDLPLADQLYFQLLELAKLMLSGQGTTVLELGTATDK